MRTATDYSRQVGFGPAEPVQSFSAPATAGSVAAERAESPLTPAARRTRSRAAFLPAASKLFWMLLGSLAARRQERVRP